MLTRISTFSCSICMAKRWSATWSHCWRPTSFWRLCNSTQTRNWRDVTKQVNKLTTFLLLGRPHEFRIINFCLCLLFLRQVFLFSFVFWRHSVGKRSCASIFGSRSGKLNIACVCFMAAVALTPRHPAQRIIAFRCARSNSTSVFTTGNSSKLKMIHYVGKWMRL